MKNEKKNHEQIAYLRFELKANTAMHNIKCRLVPPNVVMKSNETQEEEIRCVPWFTRRELLHTSAH